MRDATTISGQAGVMRLRARLGRYTLAVVGLALVYVFAVPLCPAGACSRATAELISTLCLGAFIVITLLHVLGAVRADASSLLTPPVVFPMGAALYFGFGSLSTIHADPATLSFMSFGNYGLTPWELLITSRLTFVGMAVALGVMLLVMSLRIGRETPRETVQMGLGRTAAFFLIGGALLKYGLVLPQEYGFISFTVPGTLKTLTGLTDLGFAVAAYLAVRGNRRWWLIFWVFWPINLGLSTLEFSKRVIVFAILLPAAGAFLGHRNWKRVIPWVLFAGLAYASLQDVNTAGRLTILDRTGSISDAGLAERFRILSDVVSGQIDISQTASTARAAAQVWWLRLNYSGPQIRAIDLYDQGSPGDPSLSFLSVLVPRFLWPDKPLADSQGREFNRLVSGRFDATTRVGMSVYADGYWQKGWPGLVLFAAIMGAAMGLVTLITYPALAARQMIYLPIIFLGARMAALGPMGYLQKSFIGALPIFLGYLLLIWIFQQIARGPRARRWSGPAGVPAA